MSVFYWFILLQVKYKKHKKNSRNGQVKSPQTKISSNSEHGIPPHLVNGTILKTALTNPKEVSRYFCLYSISYNNCSIINVTTDKSEHTGKQHKVPITYDNIFHFSLFLPQGEFKVVHIHDARFFLWSSTQTYFSIPFTWNTYSVSALLYDPIYSFC